MLEFVLPEMNHNSSSTTPQMKVYFVVRSGNEWERSNRIIPPNLLIVPTPVLSDFFVPFSIISFIKSRY
jgi:hypothetical protein